MENSSENKLILVSVQTPDLPDAEESLRELEELCLNLDTQILAKVTQKRNSLHPSTCLGEGKIQELRILAEEIGANLIVFDLELTPSQHKNLEAMLKVDVKDRTMIILDIFADRANTSEGKLQVELARLQYLLPRLKGSYRSLSRLGNSGGAGATRGGGESKLEMDKRYLRGRIHSLKLQLAEVKKRRDLLRSRRKKDGVTTVTICGYTNAGKSTLLNALTDANVLSENKLFATLDPTSRALRLPDGREIMLIDTVGFIRRLPHHLIDAFRSTLEETMYADLVLLVVDASTPESGAHIEVCCGILADLKYEGEILTVFNKSDLLETPPALAGSVAISAKTGMGFDELLAAIQEKLPSPVQRVILKIPYAESALYYRLKKEYPVVKEEFTDDAQIVEFNLPLNRIPQVQEFLFNKQNF